MRRSPTSVFPTSVRRRQGIQPHTTTRLVLAEYLGKFPQHAAKLDHHLQAARQWYAYRAAAAGRRSDARILMTEALQHRPLAATWHFAGVAFGIARGRLQRRLGQPAPLPLYTETIW